MPSAILIVTAGRNDLQVLVGSPDGATGRVEIEGGTRAVHRALLDGRLPFRLHPEHVGLDKLATVGAKWVDGAEGIDLGGDYRPLLDDDGALALVPAKLAHIVEELAKIDIEAVLVLNTHRDDEGSRADWHLKEPIAAGPILARWLHERLTKLHTGERPDDIGVGKAGWINYLDGAMMHSGRGRDYPLNREAVARIDRALRQLDEEAALLGYDPPPMVYVSAGGGPPGFREAVEACARFRFGRDRVRFCDQPESEWFDWREAKDDRPGPLDSFRSRENALEFVRAGDFSGAHASVPANIRNDKVEQTWSLSLGRVRLYFEGRLSPADRGVRETAYLEPLLGETAPRCLLVGMRVEAALRANRIPEAVAWTCTFLDAALLDCIQRMEGVMALDDLGSKIRIRSDSRPPRALYTRPYPGADVCLAELREAAGEIVFRYWTTGRRMEMWIAAFTEPARSSLSDYNAALRWRHEEAGTSPSDLRNLNLHSVIDGARMEQVRQVFWDAGLWRRGGIGGYFLSQDLVIDVLAASGVDSVLAEAGAEFPAELYEALVAGVCRQLADHDIR